MARERGTVVFKFLADVKDLARGVKKAEGEIGGMASRSSSVFNKAFSKITSTISSKFGAVGQEAAASLNGMASSAVGATGTIGTAVSAGAAVAGAALVGLAAKGISAFQGLAGEIRGLQRATGGSAEEASRLNAVLQALNVDSTTGQRAFFLLSKTIDTNSKKLTDHGIEIAKNKDGSVDLYQTLLNVRTAYQAAGAGAQGNAIAAAAFGRAGQALLPVLGATRDRLNEIDAAAQKHHEWLSQDQIDKAKQLGIATTELHHATEGLSIELGSALAPKAISAAKGLTKLVEAADKVGKVVGFVATFGTRAGNAINGLLGRHKEAAKAAKEHAAAEGDFADAVTTAAESTDLFNSTLEDTLGLHLKQANTAASLGDALDTLASDYSNVDESASSASATVYTFQDAMHDQFDSLVGANEATLDYLDSVDALNEALHGTAQGSEDAAHAMDRLTHGGKMASDPRAIKRATDAAVQAAEREVEAMVASGQIADTAAARKGALHDKLVDLEKQFPEVADQIKAYDDRLKNIPDLTTKAEASTKKLSTAKKDLRKDIFSVIGALKDEADQMQVSGTPLEKATAKHKFLLDNLNFLAQKYPELSDIIKYFLADVNNQWDKFIHDSMPSIPEAYAPGAGAPSGSQTSSQAQDAANRALAGSFGAGTLPGSTGTGTGYSSGTVHINQFISGDGLNSKEVADLAAKRAQRALVGSRAS